MQVYLVGGAVRDELLQRPVKERDWVVVGATPQQMEQLGYRAVGRDFPVYLHPQTHEEYALARLERKVAPGYRGFTTQFSPQVTLEQDLERRDLTINAMARADDGTLIDPFGGQRDLERRKLRHVSPAFVEDPVRVVRVARFAARYASLGFTVAPETMELMRRMVENGEIRALVPERLWRELERALQEANPEAALDCLQGSGALAVLMPELQWDAAAHRALRHAVTISAAPTVRFATLLATTMPEAITSLCERLRTPSEYRELALLAAKLRPSLLQAERAGAEELLTLLDTADALRRPERFAQLTLVARARSDSISAPPTELLSEALAAAADITLSPDQFAALRGPQIAAALRGKRLEALAQLLRTHSARRRS